MTYPNCSRLWEAEAARDGRLSETANLRFQQHRALCALCREAANALNALGQALQAANPAVDEVASRRLRQGVLRTANELSKAPRVAGRRRVGVVWVTCITALVVGALSRAFWERHPPAASNGPSTPVTTLEKELRYAVTAQAEPGTRWTQRQSDGMDEITLSEGTLSVDVQAATPVASNAVAQGGPSRANLPPPPRTHLIVRVPDGQILDVGTRFRVVVEHDQTVEIRVSEGAIVFQRPGLADVLLGPRSTWNVPAELTPSRGGAAPTGNASSSPIPPHSPGRKTSRGAAAPRAPSGVTREGVASAITPREQAPQFSPDHAGNGTEDAAYLNWISLLRAGRRDEARAVGLDYLRRFPNGFRRAEVEGVMAPLTPVRPELAPPRLPQ